MRDYSMWDSKKKKWVLGLFSKKLKLLFGEKDRYYIHHSLEYYDKNYIPVYEGDICRITPGDEPILCVVAYIPDRAAYMLLDYKHDVYYRFHDEVRDMIEVVGNVLENPELVEFEEEAREE